jgi:capsular polysaccharide biosynthesis protein
MEEKEIKIQDIFKILKSKWPIIVGAAITIATFIGLMSFFLIKPVYQANTKVFIGKEDSYHTAYDNSDVIMYQNLLKTYSELMKTNDLIRNAIHNENLDITPSEVSRTLKITPMQDTQILQISYQNNDNILAKEVLVAVVDEFMKESKELIQNGTVIVIESAVLPEYPVSPNKGKNIALAFLGGLMIGIAIVLLREYIDDTLKTKEQTEKEMEIAVIGMIPCEGKNYKKSNDKHVKKPIRA